VNGSHTYKTYNLCHLCGLQVKRKIPGTNPKIEEIKVTRTVTLCPEFVSKSKDEREFMLKQAKNHEKTWG